LKHATRAPWPAGPEGGKALGWRAFAAAVRVLLANPHFPPYRGGIEGRLEGLARGMAARGHDVAVLTARLPGTCAREERDGYEVLRCPAWLWTRFPTNPPPSWTRGVRAAAEAWAPDVLDLHYRWAPDWTRACRALAERTPLVVTWHNGFGEGQGLVGVLSRANDARFARALLPRARRVVCISDFVRRGLAARGVPPERLAVVPPGFDVPALPAERRDGPAVFVGRLVATKGLDVLLHALARAPGVRVDVAGGGPQRARLQRLAARLGVTDRARFAGFVPEAEKRALLARAPFLVHPAREEALGHALAEAMLLGCPVVGTEVGGVPEVVGPGGVLARAGDPAALADAMLLLWRDRGLAEALGSKARQHAERFTWDRCVEGTLRVYERATAAEAPAPAARAPARPTAPRP
jgi:glycosyltransferase involved in cell wall biosynthesis